MTPPYVDDGLLEIVGFRDAWHGLVLLAPKGHGTRLAQVKTESNFDTLVLIFLCSQTHTYITSPRVNCKKKAQSITFISIYELYFQN